MSAKAVSIRVTDGGKLLPQLSRDSVGPENYVEKLNWRRFDDAEILREGTVRFAPVSGQPVNQQSVLPANVVGLWDATRPNGERALVAATRTTLYRFSHASASWVQIGSGFSSAATFWEGVSVDGYLVLNNGVDLPVTFRVEDSAVQPLKELREIGVASVATMVANLGFVMFGGVTEVQPNQLNAWMNGATPYGPVPSNLTNTIRYKLVWSDYQKPTNFSPVIKGTIQAASKTVVTLDYMSSAFSVGTKVAVTGAGVDGGTLGGDTSYPDGVPITAINGNQITLALPADATNVFPLNVTVTRWTDVSTFSGYKSIMDDASGIIRLIPLGEYIVVYRETGIFMGRYTANVADPFIFTPAYRGAYVPFYPRSVVEIDGDTHVYATRDRIVSFDGTGAPRILPVIDDVAKAMFAAAGTNRQAIFSVNNPITREAWFIHPSGVIAYDYLLKTASTIDDVYTAAVYGKVSASVDEFNLILAKNTVVLLNGAAETGALSYLRDGVPYTARISFGSLYFGDPLSQKDITGYLPQISSQCVTFPITYRIFGKDSPHGAFEELCSETLTAPEITPMVFMFFRNVYFHDVIEVTSNNHDCRLVGRAFEVRRVDTKGKTRNYNGHS